jgi:hypothetical protein
VTDHPPLSRRQQACLKALVCVHQEFGLYATITSEALTHLTDEPWAGSLSLLVQYGLVTRERSDDGIGYRLTEAGWAEFAGVPVA